MELNGFSSLSSKMPSSLHCEMVLPASSLLGTKVGSGKPNNSISGVQLGKVNIPTKRCATTKRFLVQSILADVAKDFTVTSTLEILVFEQYCLKLNLSCLANLLIASLFALLQWFLLAMNLHCRVSRHQCLQNQKQTPRLLPPSYWVVVLGHGFFRLPEQELSQL